MALYSSRSICLCSLRLRALKTFQSNFCAPIYQANNQDLGVLDDFTTQLVERKSSKWERRKSLAQNQLKYSASMPDIGKAHMNYGIEVLDIDSINGLFDKAFEDDDSVTIYDLIKQCIKYGKMPSLNILFNILSLCSQRGDKDTIVEVSQLVEKVRPEVLQKNSNFEHYMAEAIWVKGNVIKSLNIFQRIYAENIYLRRKIRSILKYLILDSVSKHSEATVINLVQFSDTLIKEYNDYFPLSCLWQACIHSEWFTDQQIALNLLDKYPELWQTIVHKIPFLVKICLVHHRTEIVYRLTETLLKFNSEPELGQVIMALLNYWIKEGGVRQCKEIILWSLKNDLKLPIFHNEKLLKLFVKGVPLQFKSPLSNRTPPDYKF